MINKTFFYEFIKSSFSCSCSFILSFFDDNNSFLGNLYLYIYKGTYQKLHSILILSYEDEIFDNTSHDF